MRILYVAPGTPIPGTHGGSVHALSLCRALAQRGHEVHLAALPGEGEVGAVVEAVEDTGSGSAAKGSLAFHPLPRWLPARLFEWTAAPRLRWLAGELDPDVVVERFYTFGGGGLWAARSLGLPAVLEVNSPARPYPSLRDRLDAVTLARPVDRWRKRQLSWADAAYATGAALLPPDFSGPSAVVRNGVDLQRFRPGRSVPDDGPLRCVFVGSFRSWHGAEDLVAALAGATAAGAPLQATFIGDGPRRRPARVAAQDAGLDDRVTFTGTVPHDELPGRLRAEHVGVAPFDPEGFAALQLGWFWSPVKIFEYLAAGLPVVTVDIPELRELLPDVGGEVARFYPPGDPAALADVLVELGRDREAVRGMGRSARRLAEGRYSWDHQAAEVEGLLGRVLSAHGRR